MLFLGTYPIKSSAKTAGLENWSWKKPIAIIIRIATVGGFGYSQKKRAFFLKIYVNFAWNIFRMFSKIINWLEIMRERTWCHLFDRACIYKSLGPKILNQLWASFFKISNFKLFLHIFWLVRRMITIILLTQRKRLDTLCRYLEHVRNTKGKFSTCLVKKVSTQNEVCQNILNEVLPHFLCWNFFKGP